MRDPGTDAVLGYLEVAEKAGERGLPFALWEAPTATIRLVSSAFEERLGVSADELLGRPWPDLWEPRAAARACAAAVAQGTVEALWAKRRIAHHGRTETILVWIRRVMLGEMTGGITVIVPESDLHRFERDGTTSWSHSVCIATGIIDNSWHIEHASAEFANLTHLPVASLIGRPVLELLDFHGGGPAARRGLASWTGVSERIALHTPGGQALSGSFAWAPLGGTRQRGSLFAIITDARSPSAKRADELEGHLVRIGAELRAAGVLDKIDVLSDLAASVPIDGLTTRQWEIIGRLRRGERVASIANHLYLSQSTVRNHLSVIFRKFGVHSQSELLERMAH